MGTKHAAVTNRVLAALPETHRARLLREGRRDRFGRGQVIVEAGRPVGQVVFPETMLASQVVTMADGMTAEVGAVGFEGVVGLSAFLGQTVTSWTTICQVAGEGWVVPAEAFRAAAAQPAVLVVVGCYVQAVMNQMAQAVACNRLHSVEQRTARWLLMSHDRMGRDQFHLTQEFLAAMLGVSRTAVSVVGAAFARAGLAEFRHGVVRIYDRGGLERVACECYAVMREEFERMLGGAAADAPYAEVSA